MPLPQPPWGLGWGVPKPLGSHPGLEWQGENRSLLPLPWVGQDSAPLAWPLSACLWSQTSTRGKLLKISLAFSAEQRYDFSLCMFFSALPYYETDRVYASSASCRNKIQNVSLNSLSLNSFQIAKSSTNSCRCKDWNSRDHTTGFFCLSDNVVPKHNS